tara:strand:- start:1403 stop:1684 length:282 start_codon:yes stop_codon:yes gene_type:complete
MHKKTFKGFNVLNFKKLKETFVNILLVIVINEKANKLIKNHFKDTIPKANKLLTGSKIPISKIEIAKLDTLLFFWLIKKGIKNNNDGMKLILN